MNSYRVRWEFPDGDSAEDDAQGLNVGDVMHSLTYAPRLAVRRKLLAATSITITLQKEDQK